MQTNLFTKADVQAVIDRLIEIAPDVARSDCDAAPILDALKILTEFRRTL